jgi:hypothetical protein
MQQISLQQLRLWRQKAVHAQATPSGLSLSDVDRLELARAVLALTEGVDEVDEEPTLTDRGLGGELPHPPELEGSIVDGRTE